MAMLARAALRATGALRATRTLRASARSLSLVTTALSENGVATLTLNDPDRLNAMTVEMGEEFQDAVAALKQVPALRAVVLTGAGRAFSAGGDLDWLAERHADTPSNNATIMRAFYARFLTIRSLEVPTLAALNGAAIGAGLAVACACDMRLAAPDAKLGITFVGLGLPPGMGSTHSLPRIIGAQQASEMILTGRIIDGAEAKARGLVLDAVEDPLSAASKLAGQIAKQAPLAVRASVRALRIVQDEGLEAALRREADSQGVAYGSRDLLEGVNALRERRKPSFVGA
mmetsp:Transcript_10818/g.32270  ORF Transcript_10818/g.32270 Transcript_10818/m.32270 type:complete len:287 (+) Transcript_10818:158-1018(+)